MPTPLNIDLMRNLEIESERTISEKKRKEKKQGKCALSHRLICYPQQILGEIWVQASEEYCERRNEGYVET
jgi:hypothetical protein